MDDLVRFWTDRLDEDEAGTRDCLASDEPNVSERDLGDIAAKRELLRQYEHLKHDVRPDDLTGVWAFEAVLRAFAAAYADHPEYNEAWRP